MKIVFLDIDGVLNSQLYFKKSYNERHEAALERRILGDKTKDEITKEDEQKLMFEHLLMEIDPQSVKFLNTLIENTGAKVVITSTWRLGRSVEELHYLLDARGFIGEVIDKTPSLGGIVRGQEIYNWYNKNVPHNEENNNPYVILDDDSDMLYWQRNNMIIVDGYVGLTPTNVYKATYILNKEYPV